MIDADSQRAVDNMTAGYIKLMTGIEAEVTEPGNVFLKRKFGKTSNINIDTNSHDEKLILCITDDEDHDLYVEETPEDLAEIVERINQIVEMEENGEL